MKNKYGIVGKNSGTIDRAKVFHPNIISTMVEARQCGF
jgi:hypothetical protein